MRTGIQTALFALVFAAVGLPVHAQEVRTDHLAYGTTPGGDWHPRSYDPGNSIEIGKVTVMPRLSTYLADPERFFMPPGSLKERRTLEVEVRAPVSERRSWEFRFQGMFGIEKEERQRVPWVALDRNRRHLPKIRLEAVHRF